MDRVSSRAEVSVPLVAIVAYGPVKHLECCLTSLNGRVPVVVVDNSRSEEVEALCGEHGVQYLKPSSNIGYGAAVNRAIAVRSSGQDVLLLNPDARIDPGDVFRLQAALRQREDLAAVAPRLLNSDGSEQKTTWPVPSPRVVLAGIVGLSDLMSTARFLSGAVLAIKGEAIERVGLFDERFFLYYEEADWQFRAQRTGWRLAVVPRASATHIGGATASSSERREAYFNASAELFARKWYGRSGWTVFRIGAILAAARRWVTSPPGDERRIQTRTLSAYLTGPVHQVEDRLSRQ